MKKFFGILLALVLCFGLVACNKSNGGGNAGGVKNPSDVGVTDLSNGYTYTKQNNDGLMQFYSSDAGLDAFVNEYMERHLRYNDNAIGTLKLGEGNSVWKEWEIMSVAWMNTSGIGYSPKNTVANWFSNIYQDDYGYIWFDNGSTTNDWGMNWQFPSFGHSLDESTGYYLSTSYFNELNNLRGRNGSIELTEYWTANATVGNGTVVSGVKSTKEVSGTDYYDAMLVDSKTSGKPIKSIEYIYSVPDGAQVNEGTAANPVMVAPKPFMATPFVSPFLELDFSLTDYDSLGSTNQIDDILVYWKGGSSDEAQTDWDSKHCASYKRDAINYKESFSAATHIVFPMYANEYWGTSASIDDAITEMKIVVKFKDGINAQVRLEEVTFSMDARQVLNNCIYLAAGAYYFQYTQDTAWLAQNMDRLRTALQFLLTTCKGRGQALVTTENLVGHNGSSNYDYYGVFASEAAVEAEITRLKLTGEAAEAFRQSAVRRQTSAVGSGIGDGYWDSINAPCVSLYVNLNYYKALKGMLYLENMFKAAGLTESGATIAVKTADRTDTVAYTETVETLTDKLEDFVPEFQEYFWNDTTGRFLLGYLPEDDPGVVADKVVYQPEDGSLYGQNTAKRVKVDYGFTTFNEECIELGLATEAQAKSIMEWINGDRIVEGDTADNQKRTTQIYQYEFAPRFTTLINEYQFWYRFNGTTANRTYAWNRQIQNGGAALHCAYYDLVAENLVRGADATLAKLKNIQAWYEKIKAASGAGMGFYRSYYLGEGITPQGGPTGAGVVGVDYEFIEAEILVTAIPTAFFGLSSTEYNVLNVTPNLPDGLDWWKMENLTYADALYDLTIGKDWIQLNSVSGETSGLKVCVTLDKPQGDFTVRQHDRVLVKDTDYVVSGDKVIVTVPLQNGRIQIVK